MRITYFIFSILVFASLSGCVKNNPDPSWLEVNEWTLKANAELNLAEGELTQSITEAWVYVDDQIVGVFEVPFKIPILKSGNVSIKIYPAIKNNGISATKKIYPFLEPFTVYAELKQNETLTLNPETYYNSSTTFFIEDFEDASIKLENDLNYPVQYFADNDPEILQDFNGNFFGRINLNNTTDTMWVGTTNFYVDNGSDLPRGKDVYLEIDYYNTNSIVTGLLAVSPTSTKTNWNIQMNAQNPTTVKWKKIYIDLRELISNSEPNALFEHIFQARIDEDDSEGFIIIDNIKIVHN
jgi:hypothetical protein